MTVTYYNELTLFVQTIDEDAGTFSVTYTSPAEGRGEKREEKSLVIPLEPEIQGLQGLEVMMHSSPTKAYKMGEEINAWFSACLGYEVLLAYLGPHRRKVLGNVAPNAAAGAASQSWLGSMKKIAWGREEEEDAEITFADIAAYLVVTEESLADVSKRLPQGMEMDVTKFRPNIVVSGAGEAWEEDFWGGVTICSRKKETMDTASELVLTQNCARCVSINVDFATGKPGMGEEGSVLKKLMGDRRVDQGVKWSPIFGRYGFLKGGQGASRVVSVGDEALVSRTNGERTTFGKSTYGGPRWDLLMRGRMAWHRKLRATSLLCISKADLNSNGA